jgi:hypothetical protein
VWSARRPARSSSKYRMIAQRTSISGVLCELAFAERPGSRPLSSRRPPVKATGSVPPTSPITQAPATLPASPSVPINAEVYRIAETFHIYTTPRLPQSGNTPHYPPPRHPAARPGLAINPYARAASRRNEALGHSPFRSPRSGTEPGITEPDLLLRSLDAIHLATARLLGEELTALLTYDDRLAKAAEDAGIRVHTPHNA